MRLCAPLCVMLALVLGGAPALTGQQVEITEWQVPRENTKPRDPYVDAGGRVWFVGQRGDYVAYLEPESGGGTVRHMFYHEATGTVWFGTDANTIGRASVFVVTPGVILR